MLKERHFRMWKRLTSVSTLVSGRQRAMTASDTPRSRTHSSIGVPSKDTCYEHLQTFHGNCVHRHDVASLKSCSRGLRSFIVNQQYSERSLFTSSSTHAVTHTASKRNSTSKTNLDLKSKTTRKPPSQNPSIASRRTTNQKVHV